MFNENDLEDIALKPMMETSSPGIKTPFQDLQKLRLDSLSKIQVFAYGIGHILNDAVASLWFNFLLFFLVEVEPIHPTGSRKAGSLAG